MGAGPLAAAAPARAVAAECGVGVATVVVPPADVALPYFPVSALQHQSGAFALRTFLGKLSESEDNASEGTVMVEPSCH